MAGIVKVFIILITQGIIGVQSQTSCTQLNYNQCIRDLVALSDDTEHFYVKYTIDRVKELCSEYQKTKACVKRFEHDCSAESKKVIERDLAFDKYICDDTFPVFEKIRDCLVKPELEARAESCNSTFFQTIDTPGTGSLCGHTRALIDCLSTEVRLICGQEAADWQFGLDKAVLQPHLDPSECSLDRDSKAYCTKINLDRCFEPLVQHPIEDGSNIVRNLTEENVVALCNSYTTVRPCIDLLIDECHLDDQRIFRTLHDVHKYICDDHRKEYFEHRECLATPKLHSEAKMCQQDIETCQHAKTYINCRENIVESHCGRDAATWQRDLDVARYNPILESIKCKLRSTKAGSGRTAGTGSMGLISAIVIPVMFLVMTGI